MATIAELVEKHGREEVIEMLVKQRRLTREYAEFVVAMELGEIDRDVVNLDEKEDDSEVA